MKKFNYYTVAAATPHVEIGNPIQNADEILSILNQCKKDTQLVVFPELCLTGYTCQDLFYEDPLLKSAEKNLIRIKKEMPDQIACIIGLPLRIEDHLYNCAAFLFNHKILGIYVKTFLPSYNEYYETRWFSPASQLQENTTITLDEEHIPVSNHILFHDQTTGAKIGIEICEDLWVTIPVSSHHALAGANVLCNCSASNEIISKKEYRKNLVVQQSAQSYSGYIFASAGSEESTSDLVFSGHNIIAENGRLLNQGFNEKIIYSEIDLQNLKTDRLHFKTSFEEKNPYSYTTIDYASKEIKNVQLTRSVDAYPFVPKNRETRLERCKEILQIQAQGLATRLNKIHCKDVVIGISGGLDSTLAILVSNLAYEILGLNKKGIHAITMPGFGTTKRTKSNAQELMDLLGVSSEEISIANAVRQHFSDIHHDENTHDITYENSQARERTQILMDLANKYNAIVVGTGDLSELALGWCTYNGDHMSMYAVNASVPKTLVRFIVESQAIFNKEDGNEKLAAVLQDICDTPVSPELLPPDPNGKIQQKTEEVLGSYDLHDFFLYHMLRHHEDPEKIFELAKIAFSSIQEETIKKAIQTFYHRFFTQQFKRNCMPDGVKIGSICVSPRGDWRMPSDASQKLWSQQVENL